MVADRCGAQPMIALVPLFAFAGGFLNRHRGGWYPTHHTQIARLDYSVGMALLLLVVVDWRMALISIPLWFVGSLAPNGEWMGVTDLRSLGRGCLSGMINVAAVCALALLFGYWLLAALLLIAGAMKGPAYFAGNRYIHTSVPQFRQGPEMGEFLFGVLLGAAIGIGSL